jgi:histidine triad (HIT) family protein
MSDKKEVNCAFCDWGEMKVKDEFRWLHDNEDYYAILAKEPKIMGHTLVVSKKHYSDITELDLNNPSTGEILRAVVYWAKRLKEVLLSNDKNAKIYLMTICEHWEPSELRAGQKTTEHLHFHLLPRYKGMRTKELAAEKLLGRSEDAEWNSDMFRVLKRRLELISDSQS